MKELETQSKLSEKTQIESVVKHKKATEIKYVGSIRPQNGHILFEINIKTKEVKPAKYSDRKQIDWQEAKRIAEGKPFIKEVIINKDCVYISALNNENALDRYLSDKGSSIKEGKQTFKLY